MTEAAVGVGTQLGSYRVEELLGRGGMGDVWLAEDLRLGRRVALKVLPQEIAEDPERRARFEREAKVLASLNHPSVATQHGFEQEEDVAFLVMEYVEGEDLSAVLARGPLEWERACRLFLQVAEGLESAHQKQIVHRDLKPANIRVLPGGRAKILDFGLARALDPEGEQAAPLEDSPTLTARTEAGVLLGTARYMSQEQARGEVVDQRTDVWAFGATLYEALAGRPAFSGAGVTEILASTLRDDPDLSLRS